LHPIHISIVYANILFRTSKAARKLDAKKTINDTLLEYIYRYLRSMTQIDSYTTRIFLSFFFTIKLNIFAIGDNCWRDTWYVIHGTWYVWLWEVSAYHKLKNFLLCSCTSPRSLACAVYFWFLITTYINLRKYTRRHWLSRYNYSVIIAHRDYPWRTPQSVSAAFHDLYINWTHTIST